MPGFKLCEQEMPAELVESTPPPPQLNLLVCGGRDKKQLQLPSAWLKKYSTLPQFADAVNTMLVDFHAEFGVAEVIDDAKEEDWDCELSTNFSVLFFLDLFGGLLGAFRDPFGGCVWWMIRAYCGGKPPKE